VSCSDAAGRILVSSAKQLPGSAAPVSGRIFDGNGQVERHARQLQKHPPLLQRQQPVSVHRRHRARLQQETGERTNAMHTLTHTHMHNRFTALFPGPAGEPVPEEDFKVQGEINRGRHTDHPAGRHSIRTNQCPPPPSPIFLQAGCPSCRPTNSVKALKAIMHTLTRSSITASRVSATF